MRRCHVQHLGRRVWCGYHPSSRIQRPWLRPWPSLQCGSPPCRHEPLKFRYCEKATKFEKNLVPFLEITYLVASKQNGQFKFLAFVAFSEYLTFRILIMDLWMMKSSALGGPALNLFPMWVRVSSWTPVTPILRGSLPSKNPDHGLSSQYLWYVVFMVAALTQEKIKFSSSFEDFNQNMFRAIWTSMISFWQV